MPYADPEKQKEAHRKVMKERREKAKAARETSGSAALGATQPLAAIPSQAPAVIAPPAVTPGPAIKFPITDPQEVADYTRQKLDTRGWVIWTCDLFSGKKIVIKRDDMPPTGFGLPEFTETELRELADKPAWVDKMAYEAKLNDHRAEVEIEKGGN